MKKTHMAALLLVIISAAYCAVPGGSSAAIMLFEDKLRVKGSVYQFGMYGTKLTEEDKQSVTPIISLMRTKGTLELLYKAVEAGADDRPTCSAFFSGGMRRRRILTAPSTGP